MTWSRLRLSFDRSVPLFALVVLLMLLPAAFVLWFMNETITTQADAARRSVREGYRGQLRLVRSRVETYWRAHAAALRAAGDPPQQFARLVLDQRADGLVLLDAEGAVTYPDETVRPSGAATRTSAAIDRLARLAATSARSGDVDAVAAVLNDYAVSMAAAERLALMERLRSLDFNVALPTEAALRLSLALAGARRPTPAPAHFQQTSVRDVWAFSSDDGRVVALYLTGRIEALMHDLLHQVTPAGVRFLAFPPDVDGDPEAIAAGPSLPGWQLTYQPLDRTTFEDAARRRAAMYITIAAGGIAAMIAIGTLVLRVFRRHLHLARLKTDLVAAVSHEMRTPLASMRVLVDGLLEDEAPDPTKTREYLGLLASENARLTRVIEHFLAFARLERGRQHFTFTAAAPDAIVTAAVDAVRDRIPPACDLRIELEPDLPPVVADPEALVTALVNLLDNALKYTPSDKRIRVHVSRDGGHAVMFAVGDNGIGIPSREHRRIFRRFYRVDRRLTRETGGVGLGLSIVELIVRAHGGSVGVTSEAGRGSTFTMRVPAASAGAAA
jgi:two-component system phosphate regulon sensor histidine kinase PhoR